MSKIDDLVVNLCPNGVEHKFLDEVSGYSETRISAQELDETNFVGVDNLLPNAGGKSNANYLPNTARLTAYQVGDVLLGNIRPYLKKVWFADNQGGCSGDVLAIRISEEYQSRLLPKLLYYQLSSDAFFAYSMQHAKGAKMPRGSKTAIMQYKIPVPPLEIQKEIVKILDTFTQLEAELEAELEARRRQYEYYRDSLLTFEDKVKMVSLKDVATLITKGTTPKSYNQSGISFIKTESFDGTRIDKSKLSYIDEITHQTFLKRSILEVDDILFTIAGATIGKCAIVAEDILPANTNQALAIIRLNSEINRKYIFYILQSNYMKQYISQTAKGSAQPNLNLQQINDFIVPLPSLAEQERIVAILDKFDALVNNISEGLPAEIVARRQQYEHYRNRLLTFQEAA